MWRGGGRITGRAFDRQIGPIKSGPRPIVTAQGRIHGRMPIVLPLSAIGRSHLGDPGLIDLEQIQHDENVDKMTQTT